MFAFKKMRTSKGDITTVRLISSIYMPIKDPKPAAKDVLDLKAEHTILS